MADLHKLTVQEAMNASGSGGGWNVESAATHVGTAEANTVHVDVSTAAQIGIYSAGAIYFKFSTNAGVDVETDDDLTLPATTLTFITVPRALGPTIYFNHLGIGAACEVRIVLV